jgi:hypothetical protein
MLPRKSLYRTPPGIYLKNLVNRRQGAIHVSKGIYVERRNIKEELVSKLSWR